MKNLIKKILFEETKKDYSPAGKEIIPNKIVIHKSNPMFRDKINEIGLNARAGECYKIYVGYGEKCKPAIFATNSTNKRSWFDSTYDDDVWEINTEMIPNVKWYKDRHFESTKKHIVTFQDIPKEAIKLLYEGTGRDGGINESTDKSEDKKLKLVTKMIHDFFDEVSFIEIKEYENKQLIRVYFDNDEKAANEEMYFAKQIQDKIYEYTGIKLIPYWHNIQYYGDADFRLDAIKLKYDNLGNVINESTENKDIEKNLKVIRTIFSQVSWEGLCDIWVEYNPKDKDYEIRSKSTKRHIEHEEIIKELDYIEQTIIDLKLKTYIFTPQYVDNCEDEVKFMNENLNKSNKKILNYIYHAKIILEPFINMPEICDIEITYDELDDYYDINVVFSMEKLKEKHLVDLMARVSFVDKIKKEIKEEIEFFLPKNAFIGSTAETKCKSKTLKEETKQQDKKINKQINLLKNIVDDYFLSEKNDMVCDIEVSYNDQLTHVYLITVIFVGGYGSEYFPKTMAIRSKYDRILDNIWRTIYDLTSIPVSLFFKEKVNCDDNLTESVNKEDKLIKLLNNIESDINTYKFEGVSKINFDDFSDLPEVNVNIFINRSLAITTGQGINSIVKRSGQEIMEHLSLFPFDFKYYVWYE